MIWASFTRRIGLSALCFGLGMTLAGCSTEPSPSAGGGGAAGAGGSGAGGVAGAGGSAGAGGGSPGASFYIILASDAAQPSAMPAPAAYTTNCAVCHGSVGQGVALLGPEIRHVAAAYFSFIARNGRLDTTMLAFGAEIVSDPDLTTTMQTWLAALPKPAGGEQLYQDFCGNCHGPTGAGGFKLVSSVRMKAAADIVKAVRDGVGTDPGDRYSYMPAETVASLSDAELGLITTYLESH